MTARCLFCGQPADEWHHPTGRCWPDGPYLDKDFTIPLCQSCHDSEHAAWRDSGIADIRDPLAARLLRLAWLMDRLDDLGKSTAELADVRPGIRSVLVACGTESDACEAAETTA